MNYPPFKKANSFLVARDCDLEKVFIKIQELKKANKKLAKYLDPELIQYCLVSNLTEEKLSLVVANGSVATRIRYQTADLIRKFKTDAQLAQVTQIECSVRAPTSPLASPRLQDSGKKIPLLSTETASIVGSIAESITDPALREVMQRISKHK